MILCRDRSDFGVDAIRQNRQCIVMEEMLHGVAVVAQVLVVGPLQILVDVLALHENQRNAVDKADQVRPAPVDVAAYPELAHRHEVVFFRMVEVEDLQRLFD